MQQGMWGQKYVDDGNAKLNYLKEKNIKGIQQIV